MARLVAAPAVVVDLAAVVVAARVEDVVVRAVVADVGPPVAAPAPVAVVAPVVRVGRRLADVTAAVAVTAVAPRRIASRAIWWKT